MKIKATNSQIKGMKLCVPVDGVIHIDANGIADVSPKCAAQLVKGTSDWDYWKKEAEKIQEEEAQAEEDIEEGNVEQGEEEEEDAEEEEDKDRKEFENGLNKMKLEDMKDLAVKGEYPEEEWKDITNKKLMAAYLLKKYDEMFAGEGNEEEEEK
jgi:ABC-type Zn2+ transport system substrate-binding protein/surface adhesin